MSATPPSRGFRAAVRLPLLCMVAVSLNSCIPLLVGGAVGYVAHSQGVGVAPPLDSADSRGYDSGGYETPAPEDPGGNDAGSYDAPVY